MPTASRLAFSFEAQALRALVIIVTYGAYLILFAYLLTVIAAAAWVWRHGRRPVPLSALTVGVITLCYVLYDTFNPFPAPPFDGDVWAAAGSALLGIAVSLLPGIRRRIGRSELLRAASAHQTAGQPVRAADSLWVLRLMPFGQVGMYQARAARAITAVDLTEEQARAAHNDFATTQGR